MKFIVFILTLSSLNIASAGIGIDASDFHCDKVNMAILAKDNLPYWNAPGNNPVYVESCYNSAAAYLTSGSLSDISMFKSAVAETVKVFSTDREFAEFIHRREEGQPTYDPFENPDTNLQLPTNTPLTPLF